MTTLAYSIDGRLRLRAFRTGGKAVVELQSPHQDDLWMWCVFKSLPLAEATDMFLCLAQHHLRRRRVDQTV